MKPYTSREIEADLEQKFKKLVADNGGLSFKWTSPGLRGVPDRIVIWPEGRVDFVEIKTRTGKLSVGQAAIQRRLRDQNANVFTLYGTDGILKYVGDNKA